MSRPAASSRSATVDDSAARTIDADGLLLTPGFVDPHTHYDAQLFWDPSASPSNVHGVTTVIGGNCGFTLAPLHAADADYLRRMMAKVEGMPLAALEHGVDWSWETFAEYLDRLDGNVAVNAGFLVGHCAIRRYVMGADSIGREATESELADDGGGAAHRDRRGRARVLDDVVQDALRRRRTARRVALGERRRGARAVRGGPRPRRAPPSRGSSTDVSTSSVTTRSSCSPGCPRPAGDPSTGTC